MHPLKTLLTQISSPRRWLLCAALFASLPAQARQGDLMIDLINDFRAQSQYCEGRRMNPVPPLSEHPALFDVQVPRGATLEQELARSGYPAARAEAIFVDDARDEYEVMDDLVRRSCRKLMSTQFSAAGVGRNGDSWLLVLAEPGQAPRAPRQRERDREPQAPLQAQAQPQLQAHVQPAPRQRMADDVGRTILDAVNAARTRSRSCGAQQFRPAPPLRWNGTLGDTALQHGRDMANAHYFSHKGRNGSTVGQRANQAGYSWSRVGENIAVGQETAADVVETWLASAGHCANIMDPGFTEMGAATAANRASEEPRPYWVQVFGNPR
jgi:uncharacterized protein YkwD